MKRKSVRGLFVFLLAVSLSLSLAACGERDRSQSGANSTPEPVTSQSTPLPDASFTPSEPTETPEPTPSPTPAAPVEIRLEYEGETVTELSIMTSSVFQLRAVADDGSTGGVWTSSDASAASVDENGVVTCWKVGNPKITYTLGESSASCTLNITEPKIRILYGGVEKNDISLSSAWGFEIPLECVVTPEGSPVTWSSDNETIATVSETGYVTAHAMGTTTIYCKSGTAKASCIIRVLSTPPQPVPATPAPGDDTPRIIITLYGVENPDFTIPVGTSLDADYRLYNIPEGTPVTWSVLDPEYLSVDQNGVIVARKSTQGIAPDRNYTKLIVTCGDYSYESLVFIK